MKKNKIQSSQIEKQNDSYREVLKKLNLTKVNKTSL